MRGAARGQGAVGGGARAREVGARRGGVAVRDEATRERARRGRGAEPKRRERDRARRGVPAGTGGGGGRFDWTRGGVARARRRDVDSEDELAEFLNEFLVHEDGKCPCPGHAH